MQVGYEEHILNLAKDGDRPFVEWGKRFKSNGLLFPTMESLFEKLTQGRYFTMTEYPRVSLYSSVITTNTVLPCSSLIACLYYVGFRISE